MTNNNLLTLPQLAFRPEDLRIVILQSPYDTLPKSYLAEKIFPKVIKLKLDGYLANYEYGVMPIDTSDFISTHILICLNKDVNLVPIMGCKSIDYYKTLEHRVDFPLLSLLDKSKAFAQAYHIQKIINDLKIQKKKFSYESSFTISNSHNFSSKEKKYLFELIGSVLYNYHQSHNTDIFMGLAVPRFRTDQLFLSWGYSKLKDLDPFNLQCLADERVELFIHHEWSNYAKELGSKYQNLWDNRVEISNNYSKLTEKTVAS